MKNADNLKKIEVINVVKEKYGRKRFVRYKTGAELYDMSQSSFEDLAEEAGAKLRKNSFNRAIDTITRWCNKEEEQKAQEENREPIVIPHFSCRVFRHTFCTRLCENETNMKVIQEIMGHVN